MKTASKTNPDDLMTTQEFAEYYRCSPDTVVRWCNSKEWRIHRFAKKDGGRWLVKRTRVINFYCHPAIPS